MGRVLPSGKVFGEAVALPQIGFAKKEPFGGRIQEVAESPLTNMAVAGISRIKDELDYQDRLQAEKGRVAGAQIAERKAEAALKALQEQQTARTAALDQHEKDREILKQTRALRLSPARLMEMSANAAAMDEPALAAAFKADAEAGARGRLAHARDYESMIEERHPALREQAQSMMEAATPMRVMGHVPQLRADILEVANRPDVRDNPALMAEIREHLKELEPEALRQLLREPAVEGLPSPAAEFDLLPDPSVPGLIPTPTAPLAYMGPEEVTAEQLAEAQAALEAAQKAAAVPMQFVPKTITDFRFKVRDLETRLLQAETAEEKQSLANQIRQTISQARGAVDVQPEDLMEAITKEAGKEAQKTAYDEMTITEKEFLRQMYEASKEKRAVAAEKRAESREARAQAKHDDWKKSASRKLRALSASKRIRAEDRPVMNNLEVFIQDDDDYRSKAGKYSDEAIQAEWMSVPRSGPLSPEGIEQARQNKWASRVGPLAGSTMDTLEIGLQSAGISRRGMKAAQKSLGAGRKTATYRAKRRDALAKEQRERSKRMGLTEGQRTMETKAIGNIAALEAYDNAIAANEEDIAGAERKAAMAGAKAELDHINQMRGGQTLQSQTLQSQPLQPPPANEFMTSAGHQVTILD